MSQLAPRHNDAEDDLAVFRAIVEESHEAVAVFSADGGGIVYANPAHDRLFHRSFRDRPRVTYRDYYTDPSLAVFEREVIGALRRGESWEGVLDAKDAEGRVFPMWQRFGVAQDCIGHRKLYFGFMHDYTRQKAEENELHRAKESAEQANRAKTRFLAAANHDLRQPLQALSMFVAVLANREHPPANRVIIERIHDSLAAVEGLLNSLLDVSKLEAGLVVPSILDFSIAPLMQRLQAEFEPLAAAAGLELRAVSSSATVRSDPALLERILRNLLNNAIRYTRTGTVLFGCRSRAGRLCIQVWDTGVGIPKNQLPLIFREFHQLGNPSRDRRQGLGLGLAIVERLAVLLNHRIEVNSWPHQGSMFSVEVPLGWASVPEPPAQQLQLDMVAPRTTVLVIDDEPDVLEGVGLLLESWGYKVVTAGDCEDALERLAGLGAAPDLIIADYRLRHGSTGGQAIARIQVRLRKPIPAIILTGDTAPERLRLARASGHGLLHKPVQPASLRAAIHEILDGKRRNGAATAHSH